MSESAARLIYSTQRRLNVVINEDLFSHYSKSSTRVRVYSSIQSISLPFKIERVCSLPVSFLWGIL